MKQSFLKRHLCVLLSFAFCMVGSGVAMVSAENRFLWSPLVRASRSAGDRRLGGADVTVAGGGDTRAASRDSDQVRRSAPINLQLAASTKTKTVANDSLQSLRGGRQDEWRENEGILTSVLSLSRLYIIRKRLNFLNIYWAGNRAPVLRWLRALRGGLFVSVHSCRGPRGEGSLAPPTGRAAQQNAPEGKAVQQDNNGLHLILCSSAAEILEKGLQAAAPPPEEEGRRSSKRTRSLSHWIILDGAGGGGLPRLAYVPLDVTVLRVQWRRSSESLSLEAVWTPAPGLPLRSAAVGRYQPARAGHHTSHNATTHTSRHQASAGGDGGELWLSHDSLMTYKGNLTGVHLVVTGVKTKTSLNFYFNETLKRFVSLGPAGEVFELLKDIMNFSYTIAEPEDKQFGAELSNGSWTGMMGDLLSGRADVALGYLIRSLARDSVFSFSPPVINFQYRIFAQKPGGAQYQWEAYVRSFNVRVWAVVVVVYFTMSLAFSLTSRLTSSVASTDPSSSSHAEGSSRNVSLVSPASLQISLRQSDSDSSLHDARGKTAADINSFTSLRGAEEGRMSTTSDERHETRLVVFKWNSFFVTWSAFVQQGYPETPAGGALRALFLLNYTFGVLLVTSYSAMLVSFLTVVDTSLPFTSLQSLADHGAYRLGVLNASAIAAITQSPPFLPFHNRLIKPFPDTLEESFAKMRLKALRDARYAFLSSMERERALEDACHFTDSKITLFKPWASLAYGRGFHFAPVFNH